MKKALLFSFVLVLALVSQAWAQSRTVTGRVTDATTGEGMPGVTVQLKGTTTAAPTDVNGSYSISVPNGGGTLVFSFIGYSNQEVTIGSQSTVNVRMAADAEQLSEIVVQVPYGTVAKTAFTGSEATISSRQIQRQQVTSVTRAIEGLVPGVQATNGGGGPGSSATIRIRGIGSINSSSSPLYVVDGVPYDGVLSSLSTDDIETVTVLKDAAASALYGSRAANGVVMITTKRGNRGKPQVAVNLRSGFSERGIAEYERVSAQEYVELNWEAIRNRNITVSGQTPEVAGQNASAAVLGPNGLVYNPFNVPREQVVNPVTGKINDGVALLYQDDWSKELFRTANRSDLNINVSGGAEKSDYFLSVGYIDEKGIAKFSDYDRLTARAKVNTELNKWLNAGVNLSGTLSEYNGNFSTGTATSNPFYYSRYMGPIYPVWQRDATGDFVVDPITGGRALDWGDVPLDQGGMGVRPYAPNSNLLGSLDLDENSTRRSEATVNSHLEVKFLKDFSFRTTVGGNYYNGLGTTFQNSLFGDAQNVQGRSTKNDARQVSYTFNQVLSWNKTLGQHSLRALAGHENYSYEYRFLSATRTGFPFPGTPELAPAATATASTSYTNEDKIESYFTQVNYSFADKYLLSGSFRRDGSSRFYKDVRWGNFFSIGAGWRISQEDFFNTEWVDELKLRGSYGEQGNNDLLTSAGGSRYYAWQGLYGLGYNNTSFPGAVIEQLPNTELEWEKNAAFNIGFDFRLFNKIDGTVDYFERKSTDLLFSVPLPASTGLDDISRNIGDMKNYGWELQLGYNAISNQDFDWRVDVNLTSYKNKITKLPQEEIVSGTKKLMVGRGVYDFWLREYAGVDPQTGNPLYWKDVVDTEGKVTGRETTGVYNQGTYYYHGSAIPDLIGGVSNSLRYKGFDLAALVTFEIGGQFYDSNYGNLMHRGTFGTHWSKDILNRWQKPGDITDVPRLQNGVSGQDGASSRYLFDRTYLSIKNINLGYNLPKALISRIGIQTLRAFVAVDNAYIFTKNEGMDPQRAFTGTSDYTYPTFRTYTLGVNVNF